MKDYAFKKYESLVTASVIKDLQVRDRCIVHAFLNSFAHSDLQF